jgi:CheY-like chemotaxis protein
MSSPSITVLVIDDDEDDRRRISARLRTVSGVRPRPYAPPPKLEIEELLAKRPDAVLVDYQLHGAQRGRVAANYKGSTLAAVLRERLPDTPILLMTRASLEQQGRVDAARDLEGAFDEMFVKSDIEDPNKDRVQEIKRLVRGFAELRTASQPSVPTTAFWTLIGATAEERELLLQAEPPQALLERGRWRVPEVARWLRQTVLAYPGILYDSLHAASAIGISEDSLRERAVRTYFKDCWYTGPFAERRAYVWKGRFLLAARSLMRQVDMAQEPLAAFADAWKARRRTRLKRAVCVSTGQAPADAVCYVLRAPVMRRHSFPYRPDTRPATMEEARVSFRAIVEEEVDNFLIAADARVAAKQMERRGEYPGYETRPDLAVVER